MVFSIVCLDMWHCVQLRIPIVWLPNQFIWWLRMSVLLSGTPVRLSIRFSQFLGSLYGLSLPIISKNTSSKNCSELNFLQKKISGRISVSPTGVELGGSQNLPFFKYIALERESRFTLGMNAARSTGDIENCSNKNCSKFNFLQKTERTHLPFFPGVKLGTSEDGHFWNINIYWNGKVDLLLGSNAAKNTDDIKNARNKNRSQLKFVQKTQSTRISVFPRSGGRRLQKFAGF